MGVGKAVTHGKIMQNIQPRSGVGNKMRRILHHIHTPSTSNGAPPQVAATHARMQEKWITILSKDDNALRKFWVRFTNTI